MNEKAPEEAERGSTLRCRSARVITKARAWVRSRLPLGRRSRGLSRQEPHASGGRVHGRKYAACLQGCRLAESLVGCRQVPKVPSDQQVAHVSYDSTLYQVRLLATVPYRARFSWAPCAWMCPASRRHCAFVVRTENVEDSPLSIQRSRSAGGVRRRSVEREGSHSRNDGNPLGWLVRRRIEGGHGAEGNQTDIVGFGVRDTRPRLY